MKRYISAASLLLILASTNALAEQSTQFSATQANHGNMIIPASENCADDSHMMGDKSELLGTPYYRDNSH
ncbi:MULTISPECIES: multiple antibiotic resistance regulatory protein MarB [Buttiauxella]|jgi:hypothetical protein|uniref:Multiple antibiotic resistance regulatory periplasmic protein MarB n=1 Tax=Buttiauxella ferragutiae ATCC 51602 TaxID=1354252 RepID=A0ABX2W5F7_9ENTR|nr:MULTISPECIES: multiple antibiotic resistance regulatory protein MarB [Buttiauxella]AYN25984.1 multiple antibiotic resistance regulatory periplasmic protein MarB [Buttiauxella sp. 3AFRM03]MCE0824747.1 multiple antibiotic resistance regulatory protein MarB [Buttiauxella ferragutiae]OAT26016.1 hypothetical protein M976_03308 [Buttiauxella ferragutiae ATCC 51602]TDN54220.1 multiple antibiotic resistance protein MarB [Buttiauxella sp. JUb87]UNK59306.1 multiple antibiotic resistance regulatory pr